MARLVPPSFAAVALQRESSVIRILAVVMQEGSVIIAFVVASMADCSVKLQATPTLPINYAFCQVNQAIIAAAVEPT